MGESPGRRSLVAVTGLLLMSAVAMLVASCGGAGDDGGGGDADPDGRTAARTLGDPAAPVTIEEWGDFQ